MDKLIWVYDSPFSRSIKWLLLNYKVSHQEHILTWDEMATDELLAKNPKRQVPTILSEEGIKVDSLLIALEFLPNTWHRSLDAKLFRLADSDVEAAIIFLFRAELLKTKFGESEHSSLMLKAGIETYKSSIDHLLDHLQPNNNVYECNFGSVLLLSTILAAISLATEEIKHYRQAELTTFINAVQNNAHYSEMIRLYQGETSNTVPFEFAKFHEL